MIKLQKKTKIQKNNEILKLKSMIKKYKSIFLLSYENIKTKEIHKWREELRNKGYLYFGKKSLVKKVINNSDFNNYLKGYTFLLFSDHRRELPNVKYICEYTDDKLILLNN